MKLKSAPASKVRAAFDEVHGIMRDHTLNACMVDVLSTGEENDGKVNGPWSTLEALMARGLIDCTGAYTVRGQRLMNSLMGTLAGHGLI